MIPAQAAAAAEAAQCSPLTVPIMLGYIVIILIILLIIRALKIFEDLIGAVEKGSNPSTLLVQKIKDISISVLAIVITWAILSFIGADPNGAIEQLRCIITNSG